MHCRFSKLRGHMVQKSGDQDAWFLTWGPGSGHLRGTLYTAKSAMRKLKNK